MLSLAAGTVLDAEPAEVVEAAAAAGFDGCGLRLDPAQTPRSVVLEVRSRLDDLGVCLLDLEVIRMRANQPAENHRSVLQLAADLGADWVLTVIEIPDKAEQMDRLARLGEIAAELGVQISLEFMAFTAVRTFADAIALAADVPCCRVLVDALHLARAGGTTNDLEPHVGRLSYLQLCDALIALPGDGSTSALADEARHRRLMPGEGELDLAGLVRMAPDAPLSVEVQSDEMSARLTPRERAFTAYSAVRSVLTRTGTSS